MTQKKKVLLISSITPLAVGLLLALLFVFGVFPISDKTTKATDELKVGNVNTKALTVTGFTLTNTYKEFYPSIKGNDVVFSTRASGNDTNNDIKIYNVSTSSTTSISAETGQTECYPDINANYIVYAQKSLSSNTSWDIVLYNRSAQSKSVISNRDGLEVQPKLAGNFVIWKEHDPGADSIYAYNLTTSSTTTIRDGGNLNSQVLGLPESDGTTVVWVDFRNGNPDIYAYNLSTSTGYAVCTNSADQYYPDVDGNYIIWEDHRNDYENSDTDHDKGDIYGYNITSSTEFAIDNRVGFTTIFPRMSGLNIVAHGSYCASLAAPAKIEFYTLPITWPGTISTSTISSVVSYKGPPQINGNWVVWQDERNAETSGIDIYGYSISGQAEFAVCTQTRDQVMPIVNDENDVCAWDDYRNGYDEVAGAVLQP